MAEAIDRKTYMKYCKKCGKSYESGDYCPTCGKLLSDSSVAEAEVVGDDSGRSHDKAGKRDRVFSVFARVGKIIGLVSIGAWIVPLLGPIACVYGIVFSAMGLYSSNKKDASLGLTLNIVFFVIGIAWVAVFTYLMVMAGMMGAFSMM